VVGDDAPLFENVYQAAKLVLFTPRHTQMLNGKPTLRRAECTVRPEGKTWLGELRGTDALQHNAEIIATMLRSAAVRSQYPKHMRGHIVGSIDWRDPEAPLLDYRSTRAQYIEMFGACLRNASSQSAIDLLRSTLRAGQDVILAETDGPHLDRRNDYLAQKLDFAEDGCLLVTREAFRAVAADTRHCFGHCWTFAKALVGDETWQVPLEVEFPRRARKRIAEAISKSQNADEAFRARKAARAAATRASRGDQHTDS
jgi:hypothetical protein